MPPGTQNTTPSRWPRLAQCGVVLQIITALCRWCMGGRHVEGQWCYTWKRALVHFPVNFALCIGAYFLKDCIVDAMTPNTPLPSAVFLNISISNSTRTIRATPDHFQLDTHFFNLSSLYNPTKITATNTSTYTNTATTTLTATATSATAPTSPPRPKPPPPASGFIIIKPRAHQ